MNIKPLSWTIFFITLACLFGLYIPVQAFAATGIAILLLAIKGLHQFRPRRWIRNLLYLLVLVAVLAAGLLDGNRFLLFFSMLGLLAMWNLDYLSVNILAGYTVEREGAFIRKYILRLAVIVGISLVFMITSTSIQMDFGFGVILLLGIILVYSLSRLLRTRREGLD